jgi:hypothetical protein
MEHGSIPGHVPDILNASQWLHGLRRKKEIPYRFVVILSTCPPVYNWSASNGEKNDSVTIPPETSDDECTVFTGLTLKFAESQYCNKWRSCIWLGWFLLYITTLSQLLRLEGWFVNAELKGIYIKSVVVWLKLSWNFCRETEKHHEKPQYDEDLRAKIRTRDFPHKHNFDKHWNAMFGT